MLAHKIVFHLKQTNDKSYITSLGLSKFGDISFLNDIHTLDLWLVFDDRNIHFGWNGDIYGEILLKILKTRKHNDFSLLFIAHIIVWGILLFITCTFMVSHVAMYNVCHLSILNLNYH